MSNILLAKQIKPCGSADSDCFARPRLLWIQFAGTNIVRLKNSSLFVGLSAEPFHLDEIQTKMARLQVPFCQENSITQQNICFCVTFPTHVEFVKLFVSRKKWKLKSIGILKAARSTMKEKTVWFSGVLGSPRTPGASPMFRFSHDGRSNLVPANRFQICLSTSDWRITKWWQLLSWERELGASRIPMLWHLVHTYQAIWKVRRGLSCTTGVTWKFVFKWSGQITKPNLLSVLMLVLLQALWVLFQWSVVVLCMYECHCFLQEIPPKNSWSVKQKGINWECFKPSPQSTSKMYSQSFSSGADETSLARSRRQRIGQSASIELFWIDGFMFCCFSGGCWMRLLFLTPFI